MTEDREAGNGARQPPSGVHLVKASAERGQRIAFRPERVLRHKQGDGAPDWIINDIRIDNRSQIDRRWYVRIWRRFAWRMRSLLERVGLLKQPQTQLISAGGTMDFVVPPLPRCMPIEHKQIGPEAPGHDAAWLIECRCGWVRFASTSAHALVLYAGHKPLEAKT